MSFRLQRTPPAAAIVTAGTTSPSRRIGTLSSPCRMCGCATSSDFVATEFTDLAAPHLQRLEHLAPQELFVRRAARSGRCFARHDIEQIVVVVVGAEAVYGPQVREPRDHIRSRERIGLWPQHQIAGAGTQPAVVNDQIAHLHFARHPRVVHLKVRQVAHDRVLPAQLARIDQARHDGGRHRLGVRGDLEQRVGTDLLTRAGDELPRGAPVDHLIVSNHAHSDSRQVVARDDIVDDRIERRTRR